MPFSAISLRDWNKREGILWLAKPSASPFESLTSFLEHDVKPSKRPSLSTRLRTEPNGIETLTGVTTDFTGNW